jgi:hypothetical protein
MMDESWVLISGRIHSFGGAVDYFSAPSNPSDGSVKQRLP